MSLAARLLLVIALALLPPLAIQAWTGMAQRQEREEILRRVAIGQTRAAQAAITRAAAGVHQLLIAIAEAPFIQAGDVATCSSYLSDVARRFGNYGLLAVDAPDGSILCSSAGARPGDYSNAARAYHQRAMSTGGFVAGDLVTGLVTRARSLHFALPFHRRDGTVGGIVLASVDQAWLSDQLVAAALPPGAMGFMLDPSGNLVAAVQDGRAVQSELLGHPVPPALRAAIEVGQPAAVEATGPGGQLRLIGAVPGDPELAGTVVAVALDRGMAFVDLKAASVRNLVGLVLGGVLALLAGLFFARRLVLGPVEKLSLAAERVGRGQFGPLAGFDGTGGPLGRLAAAFERMAAGLASRDAERDRLEAERRLGEARLRLLLDSMDEGFYAIDAAGRTTLCNRAALNLLGFNDEAEAIGLHLHDIIHHSHPDGTPYPVATCPVNRAAQDGQARHVTGEVFFRADGSSFPVEYRANPVRSDIPGELLGAVCLFTDVTARQRAEAALETSQARLNLAQKAGGVGTFELDTSTRLVTVSEEFCRVWGLPYRDTVELDTLLAMILPEDRPRMAWQYAGPQGAMGRDEYRVAQQGTGTVRWIARRGEQRGTIFAGAVFDVTDLKRLEEELRQLNGALEQRVAERTAELMAAEETLRQSQKMEAVGQLTGGIAHDFNNMLQAIGSGIEMARRRVDQGRHQDIQRYLDSGLKTVGRAAALTHRLLAFARRQALQPREIEPNVLVTEVEELIRRTVGPSVTVELRLAERVSACRCDPNQLENALLNLAINARDAMPEGGTLSIRTNDVHLVPDNGAPAEPGDFVEISVGDTGTGMDEATRARAFEPFYTTKPIGQGTGLGLSQVYGFVRQSEGFVRLDSAPGMGTVVRLFLPRHAASERAAALPAPAEAPGGQRGTILLVDDETEVRELAADRLAELGYRVVLAIDATQALAALRTHGGPGLLVTDVGLPGGLNGRQLADAVRERLPDLPVLFITGYAGTALAAALGEGMDVIAKPFTLDALAAKVNTMMRDGCGQKRGLAST